MESTGSSSPEATSPRNALERQNGVDDEIVAMEKVINAFFYYKKNGQEKIMAMLNQLRRIPNDHQMLIGDGIKEHIKNINIRLEHNFSILKMIVNFGAGVMGEEWMKALRIHQQRPPTRDFMSKVNSTIRQLVREWSSAGAEEREATFSPVIKALNERYPDESKRHNVGVFVPGCGLGRLAWDLVNEGYSVQGNEFSNFMLITSCFMLNACKQPNQFTLYPYIFDKSNSWSYEDQLRPITIPDKCPTSGQISRPNAFSMCAGDFCEVIKGTSFDAIVTAWFIDTAHNIVDYIDSIYDSLEPNGVWINVGPLTYHFEDMPGETSIELPYSEVIRLVRAKGFDVSQEKRIDSKYTSNHLSMLQHQYQCAFFVATKP